jgi:DNA mismatch repair protein MutS
MANGLDSDTMAMSQPTHIVQLTPMLEQYVRMKEKAGDALLFFRMGDFYELFYEDALVASKALDIVLTSRQKLNDDPIPMCGVPAHSAEGYLDRLLQQGFKVAICEQVEDPKTAKGLVKRDIVRLITPGTVINGSTLAPKEHNFLASIAPVAGGAGFAYVDISTGTFAVTTWEEDEWQAALRREYERVRPRELLVPEPLPLPLDILEHPTDAFPTRIQPWEAQYFRPERAHSILTKQFAVRTLEGFGCEGQAAAIAAAGALLAYVQATQQSTLSHLHGLRFYNTSDFMVLDEGARQTLEIFASHVSRSRTGSLLDILDCTITAMGARLLRQWLSQPLCVLAPLQARQDAIAELLDTPTVRARLRQELAAIADLERILGRLALRAVAPRDLVALRRSIAQLPAIAGVVQACKSQLLAELTAQWDALHDVEHLIATAIVDDPPATLRDGQVMRPGYHTELDTLRAYDTSGKAWLSDFEAQERQRTGIGSLRVGFNKVFGYYIEVRKAHLTQVPDDYLRKQTLVNAERFITPALKDREVQMLRADEQAVHLEQQLYDAICQQLTQQAVRIQRVAQVLSQLDVLAALAEVAATRQYCRPQLDVSDSLAITDGRHPILEMMYHEERFVPNDTLLNRDTHQILLLTGPNMAGKSTYMRQVALLVLLAQIGSFVPAREARIGVVDRIFTRVGAQDVLAKGQSTFMVEMTETANLLHNMTARSLILLDEIGRGTSTYDGMSIAWAVIEYLHTHQDVRPRTLFATHYHELTALAVRLERVQNYNVAVREWGEKIIFLRKVLAGSADRSYGIQVARLAGLPAPVIERARQLLTDFEVTEPHAGARSKPQPAHGSAPTPSAPPKQLSLFADLAAQLLHELRSLSVEQLSPLEALNRLAEFQSRAQRLP